MGHGFNFGCTSNPSCVGLFNRLRCRPGTASGLSSRSSGFVPTVPVGHARPPRIGHLSNPPSNPSSRSTRVRCGALRIDIVAPGGTRFAGSRAFQENPLERWVRRRLRRRGGEATRLEETRFREGVDRRQRRETERAFVGGVWHDLLTAAKFPTVLAGGETLG